VLYEFVTTYRDEIIAKTMERVNTRSWPTASTIEHANGLPLFLTQLAETLRLESTATPFSDTAIGVSATRHGRDLLALGFTLSQVVHDYGDICQAITDLALERRLAITTEEFHILNRCLDTAIAESVTEHGRITAESRSVDEVERMGHFAHDLRDGLNTALIAFDILKRGTVGINGNTGAVLGRSLLGLRDLVASSLSDTRLSGNLQRRERVRVTSFLAEIAVAAGLHAAYGGQQFAIEAADSDLTVDVDPQLLGSAVMNVVLNAFKYTPAGKRVVLRAHVDHDRVCIEVEDECGGIPDGDEDPFKPFTDRRGKDRSGLGLGLSIARRAVRAHGGDIHIRNLPGTGCVFVIQVPMAVGELAPYPTAIA
jgi:signal transduction histidine kinase